MLFLILIVFLSYISLIISNVENIFMCFLAIGMSSLEKCLFRSFARFFFFVFFFGCLFFDTELQELFLCFWKLISCQVSHIICKYFLAFYVLSFHFHIYLFVFIYFFFAMQKFVSLIRLHLFIFVFTFII